MPEELAIVVIILIVVGWLVIALLKAIASGITETQKSLREASARRQERRYLKGRVRLSHFVHAVVPDDLKAAQNQLERTQANFREFQAANTWSAERPNWTSIEFKPYKSPRKDSAYEHSPNR